MRKLLLNPTPLFRKLRQLSMLLTLLLVPLGALGQTITVAGISPDNQTGAIAGTNITGTVSFDSQTNTLTLTNATINGEIAWTDAGNNPDLTIQMSGKNSVNGSIESKNKTKTCSLHIKKITDAESATLKYINTEGFVPVPDDDFKDLFSNKVGDVTYKYYTTLDFYNLEVAGMTVHNIEGEPGYKGDILNDGTTPKATFDGTSTLTLNGAELNGSVFWGGSADLTINLKGTNSITTEGSCFNSEMAPAISFTKGGDDCSLVLRCDEGNDVLGNFTFGTSPTGEGLYWLPTFNGDYITSATITSTLLGGGSGTSESPFLIKTYNDLKNFATYVNNGTLTTECIKLYNEINCSGQAGFEPIGTGSKPFYGSFDGNSKTISNLTMTDVNEDQVGLFGYNSGVIEKLTLSGCTISGGNGSSSSIGAIAGENTGTIKECTVKNSTVSCMANSQNPSVGGIAGSTSNDIDQCVVEDTNVNAITADTGASGAIAKAGGIVGSSGSSKVSGCDVKGTTTVTADYSNSSTSVYAGAVIGDMSESVSTGGNTYESTVVTKTKKQGATEYTTLSGQTERGIGNYFDGQKSHQNYDIKEIVELAGTKTVTIYVPDVVGNGGCSAVVGTYYKFVYPDYYVLSGTNFTYSMKPTNGYKPAFTLSDNTIEVTANEIKEAEVYDHTEFTFTMPNADVTATLSFIRDLSSDSYTATIADAIYTGAAQTSQAVSLSQNDDAITPFTLGIHYTIEGYKDADKQALESAPKNVGTYYATIKGVEANGFTGTKDVQFNITKANLNIVTIEAIPNQTYTGSKIEPEITVTLNDEAVAADGNFTIAYSNNTNISSATVRGTVTLTALATSECFTEGTTKTAEFQIIPKSIEGVTVTLSGDGFDSETNSFVYNGQLQKPTVTVKDGERLLYPGTDYTLTNDGGTNAGEYTVTVTGTENYYNTANKTYTITPKSIAGATVNLDPAVTYAYNGDEQKPVPEVKDGETPLTKDVDYTVSYSNNINAAAATGDNAPTVTITGKGNYDENTTVQAVFAIGQANLAEAAISKISFGGKDYTVGGEAIEIEYTGEAIHPTVEEVKFNDGTVTLDASEYAVSWGDKNTELSGADESDWAKVIITSTGKNFTTGTSTSLNFKIVAANVEITAPDQTVVYNGNKQAYTKATVNNENAKLSITYYATAEDRTNGTNALAEAPTNADTYYIRVTQTDEHYTAEAKDATFTIEQLNITGAVITLDNTVLTYNGKAQTVTVTKVMVGELEVPNDCYLVYDCTGTEAGTYTLTVTAKPNGDAFKNNFKGSATTTFTIKDRTAEISFASGLSYMTYYKADENFLIPDGVTAYIITGVGETTVTVKKVTYLKASTPILLEKTDGSTIEKNPDESFDENKLVYANADVATTGNEYVLYKNEFVKATQTITQGKCYLNLTGAAPSRGMYGIDNDGSTAINSASLNDNEEMINDNWYDLQGHRIAKPTKAGLYIVNGKKVVINNK